MLIIIIIVVSVLILSLFAIYRMPIRLWSFVMICMTWLVWQEYVLVYQNTFSVIVLGVISLATVLLITFSIPPIRRILLVRPIFKFMRKQNAHISSMEKQALTAGSAGFEKSFFSGYPDWDGLRKLPPLQLTEKEKGFLEGPVEELCKIIDDWAIRQKYREIPQYVWDFAKEHKFFGLRVPEKRGGAGLSFQAQSLILGKLASRSVDVATIVELPTSLWPDEIVEKYGTEEQKEYYMPRFAESKEIVSFAITGISNGSDATGMRDVGIVEYGIYEGKKVLGVRLSFQKRYITFAPQATLLVVGFRLFDPDNVIGKGTNVGITLALISAHYPGINIGRRHMPTNVAFPNGPIWGQDIFIPINWLLGGTERAGEGWRMIMECLFVGRAVALPSISVAVMKSALRNTAAYARIRRQFGSPIGTFEGVEEPLSRLVEVTYLTESGRTVTTAMVDQGFRPLAVSSLMKYQTTEYARRAVTDAMDIHAGRGVCDGPSNYLMSGFLAAPIGVTVEGANIVTRSIITFAQGVLQSHPYLYKELKSCEEEDAQRGLVKFEKALLGHISLFISSVARAFFHNLTGGIFGKASKKVPSEVAKWYRVLWRMSCNFAYIADITILLMGARLKKRQKLVGRLADAFSELYLLSSVLKRYEDDGFPREDYPIVRLCMENGLYRFQNSLEGAINNFPKVFIRPFLRIVTFPFGARRRPASDDLTHTVVQSILEPNATLDRLTRYIYISNDPEDITGRLEVAFKKAVEVEFAQKKLDVAIRKEKVMKVIGVDTIAEAEKKGILTKEEASQLREFEKLADRALAVDDFDPEEIIGTGIRSL